MKLMKLPEVLARVALSRSQVYAMVKDGTFPAPVNVGTRAVAWVESEIDEWVRALVSASRSAGRP
jgi:prophage regulatory protein